MCNEHTELSRIADVLDTLLAGDDVALVTDAGTPGMSDPGERLVRATLDAGFRVSAVPGPVAAVTALVISGLPHVALRVRGLPPTFGQGTLDPARRHRRGATDGRDLRGAAPRPAHVARPGGACGEDRQVAVARELTKLYETVTRGTLGALDIGNPRGEYVIVLAGHASAGEPPDDDTIRTLLQAQIDAGLTRRDAAAAVAEQLGVPKRTAYALATGMLSAGTLSGTDSRSASRNRSTEGSR